MSWTELYTGPSNHFESSQLSLDKLYEFRVRAFNTAGYSDWSKSAPLSVPDVPGAYSSDARSFQTIVSVVLMCVLLLIVLGGAIIQKLLQPKPKTPSQDIGLVRIDRFPMCSNFVHQHNELYFW